MKAQLSFPLIAVLVSAVAAGPVAGQTDRQIVQPAPCPSPITLNLTAGPPSAPTPVASEFAAGMNVAGSVWNQAAPNKHFGHTFRFPAIKECCLMTKGVLTIRIKALQPGPKNSPSSGNDGIAIVSGGIVKSSQSAWPNGNPPNTAPITINIPPQVLSTGLVSFYVQDDTAVLSAQLQLTGCCIRKP